MGERAWGGVSGARREGEKGLGKGESIKVMNFTMAEIL